MIVKNSERLSYTLMTRDDGDIMFQLDQDPEVMRYINGGKMISKEDIQNIYIPRMESYTDPSKGWGLWKIISLKNSEFIGFILVRPMAFFTDSPEFKNLELGWRFTQKSWGVGYATEAAKHIKQIIINETDVETFSAIAMVENLASIKIMEKIGMTYVKTDIHRDPSLPDIEDEEVVYYQMSAN